MIDIKELRVGNTLRRDGIIVTIDARSIFDIASGTGGYEPVPLSHEILKRYGFTHNYPHREGDFFSLEISNIITIHVAIERMVSVNKAGYGMILVYANAPLHRLQNLIYTLTGTELKQI